MEVPYSAIDPLIYCSDFFISLPLTPGNGALFAQKLFYTFLACLIVCHV